MYEFEEWKPIEDNTIFFISNYGRVKRIETIVNSGNGAKRKIKEHIYEKLYPSDNGYYHITTTYNNNNIVIYPHFEVAKAFITNKWKLPQINHKDENKQNNCVWNLEWCTSKYNCNYGSRIKRCSEKRCKKVLQYNLEGKFISEYNSIKEALEQTGISGHNISSVCKGLRKTAGGFIWKYK